MALDDPFSFADGTPRPLPGVTPALVAALEARYPDRSPSPGTAVERVWFDAGCAAVVRDLRRSLELEDPETGLPLDDQAPKGRVRTPFERARRL